MKTRLITGFIISTLGIGLVWGLKMEPPYAIAATAIIMLYIVIAIMHRDSPPKLKCRLCHKEKPLALTCETDGLCKECLEKTLELQKSVDQGEPICRR